ncbi:PspC domain-containing protein [uncultured Corynebacterium sp.]|uniref:PspC domain-containing protein n=1 Tax=uncultured Corynebacterium sp. TaxID=159447 RepID=UPI0025F4B08B|nr:PspC domain-containing protein [uncultured Corynebacterium sp.]
MNQQDTIMMRLTGHQSTFPLTPGAHQRLLQYLADTRRALVGDIDQDETVRDIEVSIGDHFKSTEGETIDEGRVQEILDHMGPATSSGDPTDVPNASDPGLASSGMAGEGPRPWRRIEEGKWLLGVCNGFATAYGFSASWTRALFVAIPLLIFVLLNAPLLSGLAGIVYLALAVILRPVDTYARYEQLRMQE